MNSKLFFSVLFLSLAGCGTVKWAPTVEDGQYMPGQIKESDFSKDRFKDIVGDTPHIPNSGVSAAPSVWMKNVTEKSPMIPEQIKGDGPQISQKNIPKNKDGISLKESGQRVAGAYAKSDTFLEFKNSEIVDEFKHSSRDVLSLEFLKDSYDYTSKNGTYEKIFESDGAEVPLTLQLSMDHYFLRGFFNLGLGANTGVGYHRGPAIFVGGTENVDDVKFTLWTIPVELSMSFEIALSNWIKLNVSGGPSALGMIQSRGDREYGEEKKTRRQVGFGYFASGKVKFGITPWSKSNAVETFSQSDVTGTYMYILARTVNYTNFKNEDLKVSGASLGFGFSFEYF